VPSNTDLRRPSCKRIGLFLFFLATVEKRGKLLTLDAIAAGVDFFVGGGALGLASCGPEAQVPKTAGTPHTSIHPFEVDCRTGFGVSFGWIAILARVLVRHRL